MLVLLLVVGLGAGILAGLFGVGGGIIFTPILFFLFSGADIADPVSWTVGSSLFCTFAASLSSSVQQSRNNNLFYSQGIRVGLFGAAGVYIGKQIVISPYYTETVFVIFFLFLLLFTSVMLVIRSRIAASPLSSETGSAHQLETVTWGRATVTGGCGGFIAALAGVGGGIVMVPIMNLLYRLDMRRAVSISSLAIVVISLSGWVQFALLPVTGSGGLSAWILGYVDFGTALPLLIGAVAGGYLGVKVNHKLSETHVQTGFSLLILAVMALMISRLF